MKVFRSIVLVALAGLVGLALIYTDRIPLPLGWSRVAFGIVFYAGVGYLLGRWSTRRPTLWALTAGWGPELLGLVGLSEALFDPARADLPLATLLFLGPALPALAGCRFALARARRDKA